MKKKFLLIGGNGLVGSSVANYLIKKNCSVTVISRSKKNIFSNKIKWIKANYYARDLKKLISIKYDVVINFIIYNPKQASRDIKFFKNRCQKYYFISSASLYKYTKSRITENSKIYDGRWPYAGKKYECEKLYLNAIKKEFPVDIIRAGHIYSENSIPTPYLSSGYEYIEFLKQAKYAILPFSINSKWALLHTDDFAFNFFKIIINKKFSYGNIINIASEKKILWKDIVNIYLIFLNKKVHFRKIDPKIFPKKILTAITGDRAKNSSYKNLFFKKNFGKFIEKKKINKNLTISIKNFIKKKEKITLNNRIIKLFFKIQNTI